MEDIDNKEATSKNESNQTSNYVIQTRKRRRDYKSLEGGNRFETSGKTYSTRSRQPGTRERKDPRKHIEAINTSYMQNLEKTHEGGKTSGRWTAEEHRKFVEALKKYGKQWKKVEDYIKTRSGAQIRSHAQKYFLKIQKEYPDQDAFLIFKNNSPEFLE